jgi:hypothetical protein
MGDLTAVAAGIFRVGRATGSLIARSLAALSAIIRLDAVVDLLPPRLFDEASHLFSLPFE